MHPVPAICDDCGFIFQSGGIVLGDQARNIQVINSGTECPKCGSPNARFVDGIYNTLGSTLEILATSRRSAQDLRRIADAINQAQDKNLSPEEIKIVVKQVAPELTPVLNQLPASKPDFYVKLNAISAAIVALATVISGIISYNQLTQNQVREIIEKTLDSKTYIERCVERPVIVIQTPTEKPPSKAPAKRGKRKGGRR